MGRALIGRGGSRGCARAGRRWRFLGSKHRLDISEVLYVPGMASNLISGKKLRKKGLFHRNDHQALFTTKEDIGMVRSMGGLPHLVQDYNPAYLAAIHDEMEPPMALTASASLHLLRPQPVCGTSVLATHQSARSSWQPSTATASSPPARPRPRYVAAVCKGCSQAPLSRADSEASGGLLRDLCRYRGHQRLRHWGRHVLHDDD